jgi:hypothetical protein
VTLSTPAAPAAWPAILSFAAAVAADSSSLSSPAVCAVTHHSATVVAAVAASCGRPAVCAVAHHSAAAAAAVAASCGRPAVCAVAHHSAAAAAAVAASCGRPAVYAVAYHSAVAVVVSPPLTATAVEMGHAPGGSMLQRLRLCLRLCQRLHLRLRRRWLRALPGGYGCCCLLPAAWLFLLCNRLLRSMPSAAITPSAAGVYSARCSCYEIGYYARCRRRLLPRRRPASILCPLFWL